MQIYDIEKLKGHHYNGDIHYTFFISSKLFVYFTDKTIANNRKYLLLLIILKTNSTKTKILLNYNVI